MGWRIAHDAFVAYADEVLPERPSPVRVLGIDETRRGKGRYEVESSPGVKVWVDRFGTGLVDLDGTGGLFAQVNGRNSAAVIAWLGQQDPDWRAGITHVSMDTSATYAPPGSRCRTPRSSSTGSTWSNWRTGRSPSTGGNWPGCAVAGRAGRSTRSGCSRTGCSAPPSRSPRKSRRRCTTPCAPRTLPVGSRNADRERKCSANSSDWPVPTRTGALIWRHLTDFYTHCAHSVDRSMADLSVADQSHDRGGRPRITRRWVPSSRCGFASTALWFRIQGAVSRAAGGCWCGRVRGAWSCE